MFTISSINISRCTVCFEQNENSLITMLCSLTIANSIGGDKDAIKAGDLFTTFQGIS